jgi:DNA-binding SARP family transcriptional activator/tetratricopeptide (TPR) repeat protein
MYAGKQMALNVALPALRIRLFGQPYLEEHGLPLRFSAPPKTLPLLAYLILHANGALTRDSIAFTLWEDDTEENARANLRRHLYHLQRALPAPQTHPWIFVDTDSLQWNSAAGAWVDVLEFTKLVTSSETLEAAVELYTGDLLQNYYDDWVFGERERLRNEYLNALYALTVDHRSRRSWSSAVRYVRAILQADPWREDAVRQLMSIQYESGDRAGALQTYADFQRKLRAEMAVDPMPETTGLHDLVIRNAPVIDVVPAGLPEATQRGPRLPSLPFVGRQASMEQLRTLWSRAARGSVSVAFIEGEAGAGKSRLAAELALRVESEGGRVLWGPTSFPESAPYQGLTEALRLALPLLAALTIDPAALAAVAALVPELRARRPDLPQLAHAEPDDERRRLLGCVAAVFEALARSRPLLLIIEDVHWAGEATIAALRFLGSVSRPIALLIVTTNREEEVPRGHGLRALARDLTSQGTAVRVAPARLQKYDVERLVAQFPALAARADLSEQLYARSEGNCLFLAQMIGDLLENSEVLVTGETNADGSPASRALPGGLREAIDLRLSKLSDSALAVAEVASVIGHGFNAELVAEVSGWSQDKVFEGFNELLDRRLIRELPKRGSFEYSFTHHLILDAVYARIPHDALVARHRRSGHVLADLPLGSRAEFAAEIARHFEIGEDREQAASYSLAAARHALSLHADSEALAYLRSALRLSTNQRLRAAVLLLVEAIHSKQGSRDDQRHDLNQLEELAARLDDIDLRAEVLNRRIIREHALGNREEEGRLVERLARHAQERNEPKWRARALLASAVLAMHTGDIDKARSDATTALDVLQQIGDREAEVECLCLLADVHTQIGALDEAENVLHSAQQAAAAGAQPGLVGRAYLAISRAAIMQHQFNRCAEACHAASELFRAVGDREGEADALARQASVLGRLQRYEEARQSNEAAAAIYEAIGKDEGRAGQLINGALLDTRLGLLEAVEQKLVGAGRIFERLGELRGLTVCSLNLSFFHLVRRNLTQAETHARRALDLARKLQHKAFTAQALANLGAVERELGRFDSALEHMQAGLELQDTVSRPADQVNDLADMALAYLMKGDLEDARRTTDRMLAAAEESTDAAFWPQVLFWTGARVYRACGKKKRTSELLERARAYAVKVAEVLHDPSTREHYTRLPVNQQIFAAWDHAEWPKP